MGHSADSQTIRERFNTQWPLLSTVAYNFEDVPYEPVEGTPYVRLSVLTGQQTQVSMGLLRRFRRVGVVSVTIFIPAGSGDGLAKELGDHVATIFQGRTVNGVIFRGTGLDRVSTDGAWTVWEAATPYQADDLI